MPGINRGGHPRGNHRGIASVGQVANSLMRIVTAASPTGCTHLGNNRKIRRLTDGPGRSHIVMARLVRAICRGTSA